MTTEIPAAAGPPCDLGDGHPPAIMSLMNLADYSQTKVCGQCAPVFMRTIADTIEGVDPSAAGAGDDRPYVSGIIIDGEVSGPGCPMCGQVIAPDDIPAHVDDHIAGRIGQDGQPVTPAPAKPDPLTAKTVRSTHGHRTRKTAGDQDQAAGSEQ